MLCCENGKRIKGEGGRSLFNRGDVGFTLTGYENRRC